MNLIIINELIFCGYFSTAAESSFPHRLPRRALDWGKHCTTDNDAGNRRWRLHRARQPHLRRPRTSRRRCIRWWTGSMPAWQPRFPTGSRPGSCGGQLPLSSWCAALRRSRIGLFGRQKTILMHSGPSQACPSAGASGGAGRQACLLRQSALGQHAGAPVIALGLCKKKHWDNIFSPNSPRQHRPGSKQHLHRLCLLAGSEAWPAVLVPARHDGHFISPLLLPASLASHFQTVSKLLIKIYGL